MTNPETKPGYLTTEFWVTILTLVLNNISALPVPDKYQGLINVLLPVAYVIARGLAKQGVPNTVPATILNQASVGDHGALGNPEDPYYIDPATLDPSHEVRDLHDEGVTQ